MPSLYDWTTRWFLGEGDRDKRPMIDVPLSMLSEKLLQVSPTESSINTESDPMERLSKSGESRDRIDCTLPRPGNGSRDSSELSETLRTDPHGDIFGVG